MPANFLPVAYRRGRIAFHQLSRGSTLAVSRGASRAEPQASCRAGHIEDAMKHLVIAVAVLIAAGPMSAQDKTLNWVKVTDKAGWQPRIRRANSSTAISSGSSAAGSSRSSARRAMYGVPDGKTWKQVTKEAPWKHSDLPMTLVHHDKMWIMGGWYNGRLKGHSASSEVWSSTDGAKWDQITKNAGWTPRIAAAR